MNPINRTLMFAGIAVASATIAYFANNASRPEQIDGYADVGKPFFPDFDDVGVASALAVVDYDLENRKELRFEVRRDGDLWVIPSHHNYPAEAADRLARTATALMGIRRTAVASRSEQDWKRFGVAPPDAGSDVKPEERGTRLTLSDGSGNPLVDLIIGNKAPERPNTDQQDPGQSSGDQYYVRIPEKDTTYITELNVDLSAKFGDWIEPDLLKINTTDLVSITLDKYSIDETRGTINLGEVLKFQKEELKPTGTWTLTDLKDESEEFDASPVTQLATNLDQLKIVGVRPKPEGLDDNMRINPVVKQILQQQMGSLGYFFAADRSGEGERLYSNEGELLATTDKGVQYTLYFGEIARGAGKDIEVGLDQPAEEKEGEESDAEEKEEEPESEEGPRRYLLVKVEFNEEAIGPKPVAPEEPAKPEILNTEEAAAEKESDKPDINSDTDTSKDDSAAAEEDEEEATAVGEQADDEPTTQEGPSKEAKQEETTEQKKTEGDEKAKSEEAASAQDKEEKPDPKEEAQKAYDSAIAAYNAAKANYQTDLKAWETKAEEGKEKVAELSERFSGWYYVISSDSFEKFRLSRKDVVSEKAAEEEKSDATKEADSADPK